MITQPIVGVLGNNPITRKEGEMMNKLLYRQVLVICLLICVLLAAPFVTRAADRPELTFGGAPYFSYAPLFMMLEEGYFEKAGINVKASISLATGTELLSALVAGQYDMVGAGVTAGLFNAILKGNAGENDCRQGFQPRCPELRLAHGSKGPIRLRRYH